jgi:hypothetical protein
MPVNRAALRHRFGQDAATASDIGNALAGQSVRDPLTHARRSD